MMFYDDDDEEEYAPTISEDGTITDICLRCGKKFSYNIKDRSPVPLCNEHFPKNIGNTKIGRYWRVPK